MAITSTTMFPLGTSIRNISSMKELYDNLQTQLSTGKNFAKLSEMGTDRYFDLALRQRVARIDGFQDNVKTVNLRLNVLDTTVQRLDKIEADARAAVMSSAGASDALVYQSAPALAASRLDEVLTLLNADVAGRYLFGGSKVESRPVADSNTILEGATGKAGFRTVQTQRRAADLGTAQMGRVIATANTDTVTLAEDGAHPFGLKLSTISSSTANISVAGTSTAPRQFTVQFGSNLPVPGDVVTMSFTLPDGSQEQVLLTATDSSTPSAGEFLIGTDAVTTAANFQTSLTDQMQSLAGGKMAAASAFAAADNFFFGQGEVPKRVDGPPYDTATSLIDGTTDDTVFWYTGEDSSDPRGTVTGRVGEGTIVKYGVQASEDGFVQLIRSQAAMAAQVFSDSDPGASSRYTAMIQRNTTRLADSANNTNGSIEMVAVELGLAKSTTGAVTEQHTAHSAQLTNMIAGIEEAPTEEIAMQILALQTRLEASYQVTAMLSKLSLVNYIS